MFGPDKNPAIRNVCESLKANDVAHDIYSADETVSRYPDQLELPSDHIGVFEKDGGILQASKAVQTFQVCVTSIIRHFRYV